MVNCTARYRIVADTRVAGTLATGTLALLLCSLAIPAARLPAAEPMANKPPVAEPPVAEPPDDRAREKAGGEAVGEERLRQLVRQLGDADYERREEAEQQLVQTGTAALASLRAALENDDPEIRRRARRILGRLLEGEQQRQLKAFIADKEGKGEHDLAGWRRYREMVGAGGPARDLFIAMHKEEAGLLASADAGSDPAAEALQWRLTELLGAQRGSRGNNLPLGSLAAVLFVSGDPQLELPASVLNSRELLMLAQHQALRNAIEQKQHSQPLRTLLGRWLLRPSGTQLLHIKLRMALQYQLPEGLELGLRALRQRELPGNYRYFGIPAVAQLGGRKQAARLLPLLDDKTEVTRRPIRHEGQIKLISIQVRDIALGWLVYVTEQDLGDYGLNHAEASFAQLEKNKSATPSLTTIYFTTEAQRDEALARWNKWIAEHPLPEPPPLPASAERPALAAGSLVPNQGVVVEVPGEEGPDQLPALGGVTSADRLVVLQLEQARRRIDEGSHGEAALLLGAILAEDKPRTYRPERLVALRRGLDREAERLLGEMPAAGREAYELQYGTEARNLLDQALARSDVGSVEAVGRRFFHTAAGRDATYLLASHFYDRNEPLRAALLLERLRDQGSRAASYEPALSVKLAACWLLADLPERAETVLQQARNRYEQRAPSAARPEITWFEADDRALAWLRGLLGVEGDASQYRWTLAGGNLARNRASAQLQPYLSGEAVLRSAAHPEVQRRIAALVEQKQQRYATDLPSCQPLVVDSTIITRTATDLCAVDSHGGQLLWKAPLDDSLNYLLDSADGLDAAKLEEDFLSGALARRLWDHATFGTLSSNGTLVFALEGLGFGKRGEHQRLVVMPDGRRRLDADGMKTYNTLAAYSLRTGKLKWEVGGPLIRQAGPLAGTFFLGPPLPIGRRLYVVGKRGERNHLLELDAETGQPTWELVLDEKPPTPIRTGINPLETDPDSQPMLREGLSPSYAGGVLVCPTDDARYVGIDLRTRSLCWVFDAPQNMLPSAGLGMMHPLHRQLQINAMADSRFGWADSRIILAGERVLLTPKLSDQLFCLDARNGQIAWSVSRRDGLYLAGVTGSGVVMVVGRANVWGIRLDNGAPAWESPAAGLPPGALPSGRGYLNDRHLYLPLSTREVAVFDVREGSLLSRTRATGDLLPGNLVPCQDAVLSQNAGGLWQLETLEQRTRQLAQRLADNPRDAETLALRGELALSLGDLPQALVDLREAQRLDPRDTTRHLLLAALLEAIRRFPSREPPDNERPDGEKPEAEKPDGEARGWTERQQELARDAERLLQSRDERLQYHRLMARTLRRSGSFDAAVDHYLRLVRLIEEPGDLEFVAAGHELRKDRWVRAELDELREGATRQQEVALRQRVLALREEIGEERLLRFFGGLPVADELRLDLAGKYADQGRLLEAELLLRQVLDQGEGSGRNEAVARLAVLLRRAGRPYEAARFYTLLAAPLRDVPVDGESTGDDLLAALDADDPVRRILDERSLWPPGSVDVRVESQPSRVAYGFPVTLHAGPPLTPRMRLTIASGNPELVVENAWASRRVEVSLASAGSRNTANMRGLAEGALRGHLFLAWMGNHLVAVDLLSKDGKLLWNRQLQFASQAAQQMKLAALRMRAQQFAPALTGSDPRPLAVAGECACFVENGWLVAVDILDGGVLWKRDGFPDGGDLLTDDRHLFVTTPGQEDARVLRLSDGSDVATRRMPALEDRLLVRGGRILTWRVEGERARLALWDASQDRTAWQQEFDAKAQPAAVAEGDEVLVVEPGGRLTVIDVADGQPRWVRQHAPLAKCREFYVLRSQHRYLLFNNSTESENQQAANRVVRIRSGTGNVAVYGHVVAAARDSGEMLWSQPLDGQSLDLQHPPEVPVLAFLSRMRVQRNNRLAYESEIRCLDQRTGKVLHQSSSQTSNNLYEIQATPEKAELLLRTIRTTVRFGFGGEQDEAAKGEAAKGE